MRRCVSWPLAMTVTLMLVTKPSLGHEVVRIAGTSDQLRLEPNDNTVDDVLTVLRSTFGLQYRSALPLDRRMTGTYRGSMRRVVSQLLDGYSFVTRTTASGSIELMVFGANLLQGVPQLPSAYADPTAAVDPVVMGIQRAMRAGREKN